MTVGALGKENLLSLVEENPDLNNSFIPQSVMYTLPAFKTLENIIAVPHIGYYRDDTIQKNLICKYTVL